MGKLNQQERLGKDTEWATQKKNRNREFYTTASDVIHGTNPSAAPEIIPY